MRQLDWSRDAKLLQSPLLEVRAGRAFILTKGRNAWNSTWIGRYQMGQSLFSQAAEAMEAAETLRGPGNVFYVREIPVLGVYGFCEGGYEQVVVCADFHADNPFDRWDLAAGRKFLTVETPLGALINVWSENGLWRRTPPSPHSLVRAIPWIASLNELRPRSPAIVWTSEARGAGYKLSWRKSERTCSFQGVKAIEAAFRKVNSAEALRAVQDMRRRVSEELWEQAMNLFLE